MPSRRGKTTAERTLLCSWERVRRTSGDGRVRHSYLLSTSLTKTTVSAHNSNPGSNYRSMKLKELAYFHAEGYSGGALKHGPFALIEGNAGKFGATPVIMIVLDDQHAHHMRTAAEEVKARGAEIIIITDNPSLADGLDDDPIVIPSNGPLTALGAIVPLQLLSYELALLR